MKQKKRIGSIGIIVWFLSVTIFLSAWNADRFVNMMSYLPSIMPWDAKIHPEYWETWYTEYFRFKEPLAEVSGMSFIVLDKDSVDNYNYMKDKSGNMQLLEDDFNRAMAEEQMLRLAEAFQSRSIACIFASLPPRFEKDDFPVAKEMDFFGQRDEKMLSFLSENGVEIFDAGKELKDAGLRYLYPFKTDIHLETEGEFETARLLSEKLSSLSIDIADKEIIFDKDNYAISAYPFAGNLVKSSGSTYTFGKDSFELWYPSFETNFTVENPAMEIIKEGPFGESIMNGMDDPEWLATGIKNYWVLNYLQYPSAYYTIENHMLPNGSKLLFIIDSYAMRTAAYLSLGAGHITVIDPRGWGGAEHLAQAMKTGEYDAVIVAAGGKEFYESLNPGGPE